MGGKLPLAEEYGGPKHRERTGHNRESTEARRFATSLAVAMFHQKKPNRQNVDEGYRQHEASQGEGLLGNGSGERPSVPHCHQNKEQGAEQHPSSGRESEQA